MSHDCHLTEIAFLNYLSSCEHPKGTLIFCKGASLEKGTFYSDEEVKQQKYEKAIKCLQ